MTSTTRNARAIWHWYANSLIVGYLAATVVVTLLHAFGVASLWLLVHVFLLGAMTNAIVIWSTHFATTLLHPELRRAQVGTSRSVTWRLVVLNCAIAGVLVGATAEVTALTVAAAAVLTLAVASHGALLLRAAWGARAGRFAVTVRFYWLAVACVISGIAAGTALEVGVPADWRARVFAVHVHVNLFGWVALTVLGTEFTFWPMVLHARIAETFARSARQALRLCTGGIALLVSGLLTAGRVVAVIGLLLYIVGVARSLDPFVRAAVQRRPHSAAAWMLAVANGWLVACLVTDTLLVATASDAGQLADRTAGLVPSLLTGFVVQVLTGALTYLLPVVVGRGPAGGRRAGSVLDRAGAVRILVFNAGVALIALPLGKASTDVGWCLVGASVAAFVGLAAGALFVTRRAPRVEAAG